MDTRAGLDGSGISRPNRDPIPGPSSPSQVAIPTETESTDTAASLVPSAPSPDDDG